MITRMLGTTIVAAVVAFAPLNAAENDNQNPTSKVLQTQTACPLTGQDINREIYADHNGKRVYFCCADCKVAFNKDPEKVMSKLMIQHIKLEKTPAAQTACPMTGKSINKKLYSDIDGKRVYFCCNKCKTAFDSEAETRETVLKKLKAEGVMLEKAALKQSMCPVMGGKINTALYSDADGKRVFFCCPMCKPAFEKESAKYIHELEAEGIELAKAPKGE